METTKKASEQQGGQYGLQSNAEENHNKENSSNEQLVTNEPIEETPFRLIGVNGYYFIAYGQSKVTINYKTREEALEKVYGKDWGLILSTVIIMMKNIERDRLEGETIDEMLDRKLKEDKLEEQRVNEDRLE